MVKDIAIRMERVRVIVLMVGKADETKEKLPIYFFTAETQIRARVILSPTNLD